MNTPQTSIFPMNHRFDPALHLPLLPACLMNPFHIVSRVGKQLRGQIPASRMEAFLPQLSHLAFVVVRTGFRGGGDDPVFFGPLERWRRLPVGHENLKAPPHVPQMSKGLTFFRKGRIPWVRDRFLRQKNIAHDKTRFEPAGGVSLGEWTQRGTRAQIPMEPANHGEGPAFVPHGNFLVAPDSQGSDPTADDLEKNRLAN